MNWTDESLVHPRSLDGRWRYGAVVAAVMLGVALVPAVVPSWVALAVALVLAAAALAARYPVPALAALLVAAMGPALVQVARVLPADLNVIAGRLSIADLVLTAMMLAVPLALTFPGPVKTTHLAVPTPLVAFYLALAAWVVVEIVRNWDAYGLSTLGQFRTSYLVLAVPAFMVVTLRSTARRRAFVLVLLAFSIAAALCAIPVVGVLRGWGIGPSSRYLTASVSLGLLYGWAALFILRERGVVRLPRGLVIGLALPVAAVLLVDSHRSVWLAGLVLAAYFALRARVASRAFAFAATLLAAVVALTLLSAIVFKLNVLSYVTTRGGALVNPVADRTSSWRLDLWESNLELWWQHPVAGEGLGGYYTANALRAVEVTTGPHSLFVQILVSLGAVGLALFMATAVWTGLTLRGAIRGHHRLEVQPLDVVLVELGAGVLLSALVYWSVYALDYASLLWIGLGLAAATSGVARRPSVDQHGGAPTRPAAETRSASTEPGLTG